jgi:GNAT superfamily N-acetyltransferase
MTLEPDDDLVARAMPRDVPEMEALVARCIAGLRAEGIEQWDEAYPSRSTLENDVASGAAYVLRIASRLVGMYVLNTHQDLEYSLVPWEYRATSPYVVHRLMIDPASARRGYARRLMSDAEARAITFGADVIRLDAFDENPRACALYSRIGYRYAGNVRFRKGLFRCYEKQLGVTL